MNKSNELLPCPFCGLEVRGEPTHYRSFSIAHTCKKRGIFVEVYPIEGKSSKEDVIKSWNTRHIIEDHKAP